MNNIIFIMAAFVFGFGFGVTQRSALGGVDMEQAVRVAYDMGRDDERYSKDDIGLVRLSYEDLEGLGI